MSIKNLHENEKSFLAFEPTMLKIKEVLDMKGASDSKIARQMGIERQSLRAYKEKGYFPASRIVKFCLTHKLPVEDFMSNGENKKIAHPGAAREGFVYLPRYDVQASAGSGSVIHSEQIIDHLAFKLEWIKSELGLSPDKLILISAVGDSMFPTIRAGALLLINTAVSKIKDDSIYIIRNDGSLMVKRIQSLWDGSVKIISDNPKYEPIVLKNTDALNIVGEVVWGGQRF